jgi:hypothetical protein
MSNASLETLINNRGVMRRRAILLFLLVASLTGSIADIRTGGIDFFILMDTSLSMDGPLDAAKKYVAGEIAGRLVEQGDWVALVRFFGKSETVWSGEVNSSQDTAALVRSLNLLSADGRYTDIGLALDYVDSLVLERGKPERPKYIVLVTDERQEAPKDTKYYSPDYSIHHPLLEYVKRIDFGDFRLITVGYGLTARVESNARSLIITLASPPEARTDALAGSLVPGQTGNSTKNSGNTENTGGIEDSSAKKSMIPGVPDMILIAIISIFLLAAVLAIILLARRRKKSDEGQDKKTVEPV